MRTGPEKPALSLRCALVVISLSGMVVPNENRGDWRQAWEAEAWYRWHRAEAWGRPAAGGRFRLLKDCAGAIRDAIEFRFDHMLASAMFRIASGTDAMAAGAALLSLAVSMGLAAAAIARAWPVLIPDAEQASVVVISNTIPSTRWRDAPLSVSEFQAIQSAVSPVADVEASFARTSVVEWAGGAFAVRHARVTPGIFETLAVHPLVGNLGELRAGEDVAISERFWRERMDEDKGVVGSLLSLPGRKLRVSAVIPELPGRVNADVWEPIHADSLPRAAERDFRYLVAVGRLREDTTLEQASGSLTAAIHGDLGWSIGVERWNIGSFERAVSDAVFFAALALALFVAGIAGGLRFPNGCLATFRFLRMPAAAGPAVMAGVAAAVGWGIAGGGNAASIAIAAALTAGMLWRPAGMNWFRSRRLIARCARSAQVCLVICAIAAGAVRAGIVLSNGCLEGLSTEQCVVMRPALTFGPTETNEVLDRVRAASRVVCAGAVSVPPGAPGRNDHSFVIEGGVALIARSAVVRIASPGYFETVRIRVASGRVFDGRDGAENERVVVVNRAFARAFLATETSLGNRIRLFDQTFGGWRTIAGIVEDHSIAGPGTDTLPALYLPAAQCPPRPLSIVARIDGDPDLQAGRLSRTFTDDPPSSGPLAIARLDGERSGYAHLDRGFLTLGISLAIIMSLALGAELGPVLARRRREI